MYDATMKMEEHLCFEKKGMVPFFDVRSLEYLLAAMLLALPCSVKSFGHSHFFEKC